MDNHLSEKIFKLLGIPFPLYNKFPRIKKRKNRKPKIRWIHAPNQQLKEIQRKILHIVLYQYAVHPCAHAYVAQKNIRSGAFCHTDFEYTIVLDIKEFFPSITCEQIKKALEFYTDEKPDVDPVDFFSWDKGIAKKIKDSSLPKDLRGLDILVELCTHEGVLPQGAPTSGALSNIVLYPLDSLFEQVCVEKDFAYTRYADDLTFSGNNLEELKKFVFGYVFKKLNQAGFTINKRKVHVFQKEHRLITGLNVHEEGVRPSRKYRRKLRARLANLRKEFQKCENVEELHLLLKKNSYLRPVIGHLWYVSYTDTYSSAVPKMICDYFLPIAECIQKFYPKFSEDEDEFYKILPSNLASSRKFLLDCLHKEMRKMKVTGIEELRHKELEGVTNPLNYVSTSTKATYREKRDLISSVLSRSAHKFATCLTLANFQTGYRIASPEDKLTFLLKTIRSEIRTRGIWHKTCLYASRLPYKDRLEVLQTIGKARSFLHGASPGENIVLRMSVRKIMRGLNSMDLSEFATSDNSCLRLAAQDMIRFRNKEVKPQEEGTLSPDKE